MSARIATAPSSATATPLARPTAATSATGGTDGSQAAPAARGAPGSSNGAAGDGGSNTDFFTALIEAAQTDGAPKPSADGAKPDRGADDTDGAADSSDLSQSSDGGHGSTLASTDAAATANLIAPTTAPDVATLGLATTAAGAGSVVRAGQLSGRGGALRSLRLHSPSVASSSSADAVTSAILAMANALPGAPVLAAARSPADGSSTAADGGSSVTSSTGSSGLATMGSVSQWSAGADVGALRQRLDAAGVSILAGSDHGAGDQGDDSRSGPAGNAAPPALGDLVRSLPSAAIPMGPRDSSISVPVGSDGWPRAVAAQLHWFVSNGVQSATLRLVPDHLGPIDVHVDVQQSQVNVNFTAAHPDTRAALEQTVPRLREILAGSGLTLGHANVQQQPQPRAQTPASAARTAPAAAPSAEPVAVTASPLPGLVDEYA